MVIKKPPKKFLFNLRIKRKTMTDRNKQYMMEMWGTDKLVTDYGSLEKKKLLREVTTEKFMKEEVQEETELFSEWDYGMEEFVLNT